LPRPANLPEEELQPHSSGTEPANFMAECIRAAQKRLSLCFSQLSQTRYEAGESGNRVLSAQVQPKHNESGGKPYFWFAVHFKQLEFVGGLPFSLAVFWLRFGWANPPCTSLSDKPFLAQMSEINRRRSSLLARRGAEKEREACLAFARCHRGSRFD